MLDKRGLKAAGALKTGTTIAGIIFKVPTWSLQISMN